MDIIKGLLLTCYREYLTGFHKRKVERRKHAQVQLEQQKREERLALRKSVSFSNTILSISLTLFSSENSAKENWLSD